MGSVPRLAVLAYATLALLLLLAAIALQTAFFAHHASRIQYTTPVRASDVVEVAASFRPRDLFSHWPYPVTALFAIATWCLVATRRQVPASLRLLIALPQLVYLPLAVLAPAAIAKHLNALAMDRLDGEWLHEGWPFTEALPFWLPVPLMVALRAVWAIVDRYVPNTGSRAVRVAPK
jgi:hypothetical protein